MTVNWGVPPLRTPSGDCFPCLLDFRSYFPMGRRPNQRPGLIKSLGDLNPLSQGFAALGRIILCPVFGLRTAKSTASNFREDHRSTGNFSGDCLWFWPQASQELRLSGLLDIWQALSFLARDSGNPTSTRAGSLHFGDGVGWIYGGGDIIPSLEQGVHFRPWNFKVDSHFRNFSAETNFVSNRRLFFCWPQPPVEVETGGG